MVKIPRKYRSTCNVYKHFAKSYLETHDFSQDSMLELFLYESRGVGIVKSNNGFALGKKWMDVTLSMWKEDLYSNLLSKEEFDEYQTWLTDLKTIY